MSRLTTRSEIIKRSRELRRRARARQWYYLAALVLALLAGLITLAHWDRILYREVVIDGAVTSDPAPIRELANTELAGNRLLIFPKRNILLFSKSNLAALITTQFPELSKVEVGEQGNDLLVTITERDEKYLWCDQDDIACYFLDQNGIAFAPAPSFSGHPYFEFEHGLPPNPVGQAVLSRQELTNALEWRERLVKVLNMSILATKPIRVVLGTPHEFHFQLESGTTVITGRLTPDEEPENLAAALKAPEFAQEYRTARAAGRTLDYLDLRFTGKMFYKFR